jgi:hypothetical protein
MKLSKEDKRALMLLASIVFLPWLGQYIMKLRLKAA